jgi:putative hydrolase of the HAD superfamily
MQRHRLADALRATGSKVGLDLAALEQRRSEALTRRLRLFDDAAPCLAALREEGLLLAAVTNSDGPHQRGKLVSVGLADAFDAVVISGEVGVSKPAAGIFHRACAELGVAPGEALHVGDKLGTDARGARDAGLTGVWLDRRGRHDAGDALPAGVHRVVGLDELPGLVHSLGVASPAG